MKPMKYLLGTITLLTLSHTTSLAEKTQPRKVRSLASISTVLVSGDYCAMIPKGAILYAPDYIKGKDSPKLKGTLVNWKTFLRKNSGWIHMQHVSMEQAAGKETISQETIKAYQSVGKMVIAHNHGDLVSVKAKAYTPQKE